MVEKNRDSLEGFHQNNGNFIFRIIDSPKLNNYIFDSWFTKTTANKHVTESVIT